MTLVGRVFTNRYEIQRELAQGGMAEVYLARDRLLDRLVALKALFPEYARDPQFVERFRREAQAAANLNHPNIVAIHDWGQESGTYFIVMEYVEGRSLRHVIRSEGPLAASQAADIAAEIAAALAFAHRSGIVHRDVKPGNVLLTRSGNVKVTDLGIVARPGVSEGLTQTGSVMGTATYFSPEQAQGLPVDGRSDIYSLGVVLYEMVTGVAPFTGDSPVAVAYKHVREEPVPPSRRNPDVPPDLEQIILTAMAKDPDLRYQSADDLRADLMRFRRGRPLAAAPVTALVSEVGDEGYGRTIVTPRVAEPTRVGPTVRPVSTRNRNLWTALTILGLVVIVALVIILSQLAGSNAGEVEVPDVVGALEDDAVRELENAGFRVEVERVPSDTVPEREVISQDPGAGDRIDRGDTVTIEVSAGSGRVEVPSVEGLLATDAEALLEDAGFNVDIDSEPNDEVPQLEAIRTVPPAGEQADRGSTVTLVVSSGPPKVRVPNVLNLDSSTAVAQLTADGLRADVRTQASDTVPEGNVISTDPPPNAEIVKGSTVIVVVSGGPAQSTVPSVVGFSEADARNAITAAGLQPSVIYAAASAGNVGRVIAQDPAGNTEVDPGSVVVITVGEATTTTTSTPASTTTTAP